MVIWSPIYSCDYDAITQPLVLIKQPIEARLAQCLAHLPHLDLRLHAILAEDGAHVLSGWDDRFRFARGEVERWLLTWFSRWIWPSDPKTLWSMAASLQETVAPKITDGRIRRSI